MYTIYHFILKYKFAILLILFFWPYNLNLKCILCNQSCYYGLGILQIIRAADVPNGGGLGFGRSISGGIDVDGNNYPGKHL